MLSETEFMENGAKVAGLFDGCDSGHEFGFGRTRGSDGLCFATVGNSTATQEKSIASGRTSCA